MKKFFATLLMLFVIFGFSLATIGCGGGANKPKKEEEKKKVEEEKKKT